MKKTMMSIVLMMSVLSTGAFAQQKMCLMKFSVDRESPASAEFNFRMNGEIVGSPLASIAPGESYFAEVYCDQKYEIFATPFVANSHSNRSSEKMLGRCSYIGNQFYLGDRGGISVVYPHDFICQ